MYALHQVVQLHDSGRFTIWNTFIYDILHFMNDPVARVLDVSQKMHELRGRLEELDAERARIQQEIAGCMEQLAHVAGGQVKPPPDSTMSAQILWVLRRHPDRPLAPIDIAGMLDIRHKQELTNLRVLLSRMGRDGRARRVAHGRYMAIA
jgi:hypothetical protein